MKKPEDNTFLDELCDSRPSSRIMLREAWPALSPETQMTVLYRITSDRNYPEDLELIGRALSSPNAYIRYLAVRCPWVEAHSIEEEAEKSTLRDQVNNDPSPLVQGGLVHRDAYSQLVGLGPDPARVLAMAPDARITLLRRVRHPVDWFPKLIRKAASQSLPEQELQTLIEEYLASHVQKKFANASLDTWADRDAQRGLAELWRLSAQLMPQYPHSALLLITRLPTRTRGSATQCIPEDALAALDDAALVALLNRRDVDLAEFRGQILVQAERPGDDVLEAAASRRVALSPAQFATLLTLPERIPALEYCEGLPLVMAQAMKECFRYKYGHARFGELTDYPNDAMRSQLSRLPPLEQRQTVKELRAYQLATVLAPWPGQTAPYDEFARSSELIGRGKPWSNHVARLQRPKALAVAGDPWATYCNFGRYFDIRENYEALRQFSSGYYPDDVPDGETVGLGASAP
jgi:hypothetical protein